MADSSSDTSQPERDDEKDKRQKQIETAVKFLQNPKVRQTPMAQRKAFLAKKGLSKEEIELAVQRSGTAADEFVPVSSPSVNSPLQEKGIVVPGSPIPKTQSPWQRYLIAAVVGGGFGYIVAHLIKTYLLPYLITKKEKQDEKLERIESSVVELKGNITETVGSVQTTLNSVQKLLREQQSKIQALSADLTSTQSKLALIPPDSFSTGELKNEILSLKGLLLNRKQFPSPLIQSTPGVAGIPAWQRTQETVSAVTGGTSPADLTKEASSSVPGASTSVVDYSTVNGDSPKQSDDALKNDSSALPVSNSTSIDTAGVEVIRQGTESPRSTGSETDTDSTGHTVITPGKQCLDDALMEDKDASLVSTDTSLSSLSDESGGPSFHESSIKFSSTCVKVSSDSTLTGMNEPDNDN